MKTYLYHIKVLQKLKFNEFFEKYGEDPENVIVEGIITSIKPRAGFIVESADGVEFFMPMAQGYIKAIGAIGKKIKAVVIKAKKDSNSIVISRKNLLKISKKIKMSKFLNLWVQLK